MTAHTTRLVRVHVGIGYRWWVKCATCGRVADEPLDRESAEWVAKEHGESA